MPAPERVGAIRLRTLISLVAALALTVLNALNLFAGAYAQYAEDRLDAPPSDAVVASADLSARLTPWDSRRMALLGWILAERGDGIGARTAYVRSLRWAPADALLWNEFALALTRTEQFGAPLETALARANDLAPTSPAVQASNAAIALSYWRLGTPALQREWLQSLRYELDNDSLNFRNQLTALGYWRPYCDSAAAALGDDAWCLQTRLQWKNCQKRPADGAQVCEFAG